MLADSFVAMVSCPLISTAVAARAQASRTSIEAPVVNHGSQADNISVKINMPKTGNLLIYSPSRDSSDQKIITNIGQ